MNLKAVLALTLATAACSDAAREPSKTTVHYERVDALRLQVVDNDSTYMRRVFERLAPERSGRPTDATALGAGVIAARQDMWTAEDLPGQFHRDYYLEAANRGAVTGRTLLENYFGELAARDPSFAVPADRQLTFEETEPGYWRSYYVDRLVQLDGRAVEDATLGHQDDRPVVLVDLTADGGRAFGKLTSRIAGKKLATISGDTVVVAPIVNGQIQGGKFTIAVGGIDADAQEAAAEALVAALDRD